MFSYRFAIRIQGGPHKKSKETRQQPVEAQVELKTKNIIKNRMIFE